MDIIKANKLLKDYLDMNMGIVGVLFENDPIYHLHFTNGENDCFQENENIKSTLIIHSLDQLHLYIDKELLCEQCLKDWLINTDNEINRVFKEIGITKVLN
jgi:hypothetical protein